LPPRNSKILKPIVEVQPAKSEPENTPNQIVPKNNKVSNHGDKYPSQVKEVRSRSPLTLNLVYDM